MLVTYRLIEHFLSEDALKALGVCIKLKLNFTNSILFRGKSWLKRCAAKCKLTARTLQKYLRIAKDLGFISYHSGNIMLGKLLDLGKTPAVHNSKIGFHLDRGRFAQKPVREILDELRAQIFRANADRYMHVKKADQNSMAPSPKVLRNKNKKLEQFYGALPGYVQSYQSFGKKLSRSKTTACYHLTKMIKSGFVQKIVNTPRLLKAAGRGKIFKVAQDYCGTVFMSKHGNIYRAMPNSWILT